jgi:5-methylcytosine-specific restriction endonuclease McrA
MAGDPFYTSKEWRRLRWATLVRDHHKCVACGEHGTIADHIKSRRSGGADDLSNTRTLCRRCDNRIKESRSGTRANRGVVGVIGADGWPVA